MSLKESKKWIAEFRKNQAKHKRLPANVEEGRFLAGFYGYRGRQEIDALCGISSYALRHFNLDYAWKAFLCEHIGEEASHGVHYIKAADKLYPKENHWIESAEWEGTYGYWRRWVYPLAERGFLEFTVGLLLQIEGYGQYTAPIYGELDAPEVLNWRLNEQLAEEDEHEQFFAKKIREYLDNASPKERGQVLAKLRQFDVECMRTGYLADGRFHHDLLIRQLNSTLEQYGKPFRKFRENLWLDWFGIEAPGVEWPRWMKEAGVDLDDSP